MKNEFNSSGLNVNVQFTHVSETIISDTSLLYETTQHKIYCAFSGGRKFVLKTVNPQNKYAIGLEHILDREYQILQQLDNPYIVRVWQLGDIKTLGKCIIMEYVDGIPMDEYLSTHPSKKQRKQILLELLEALSYLHSKQIVHGDIKPLNILITRNGNHVKLIDLGLASKDEYIAHNIGFTNLYAAPEQKGIISSAIDERTDIYALGYIIKRLFPYRYFCVRYKCQRLEPLKRFSNIYEVKRALSLYFWLCGAIICVVVISIATYFGWQQKQLDLLDSKPIEPTIEDTLLCSLSSPQEIKTEESSMDKEILSLPTNTSPSPNKDSIAIQSVHSAYQSLYMSYMDSISQMSYQYQDFGLKLVHSFVQVMYATHLEYKSQYEHIADEIEIDYMTQYGKYYPLLMNYIAKLPDLWTSYQTGNLSLAEYERLHQMVQP